MKGWGRLVNLVFSRNRVMSRDLVRSYSLAMIFLDLQLTINLSSVLV